MIHLQSLESQLENAIMSGDEVLVATLTEQIAVEKQAEIDRYKFELSQELQRGALKDDAKIAQLQQLIDEKEADVDAEARRKQYEQRVEESQKGIEYALDSLEIEGIQMRDLCSDETSYQILRIAVQELMMQKDQERLEEISTMQTEHAEHERKLKNERDGLQKSYDELCEMNNELRKEVSNLRLEVEDLNKKRQNAANEIDRLNSHIDDLRAEKALGAKESSNVINVTGNDALKDLIQKHNDSKPAITNKRWADEPKCSIYLAEMVETGETIEFGWLSAGKYREVTAEEADQFRAELADKKRAEEANKLAETNIPVPVIPSEPSTTDGVDTTDSSVEVAGKTVEERLAALEVAVFGKSQTEAA